jgi:hypothetical protein
MVALPLLFAHERCMFRDATDSDRITKHFFSVHPAFILSMTGSPLRAYPKTSFCLRPAAKVQLLRCFSSP